MILLILGCLLVAAQVAFCQQCPDLNLGPSMQASSTTAEAGDPPVTITCDAGYKLDTDELVMYLECGGSGTWNDTLRSCIRKVCPNISLSLLPHMNSDAALNTSYFGDSVTVNCDTGYAYSVDTSLPVATRVTSSMEVTCQDDPNSIGGQWSALGTCSVIQCADPPEVANSNRDFSTVTYGSTVVYRCHSGYSTYNLYSTSAHCNDSAAWESSIGPGINLETSAQSLVSSVRKKMGCYDFSCLIVSSSSSTSGGTVKDCIQFCKTNAARFAALSNGTCDCMDEPPSCSSQPATSCDDYCPQYDAIVTDSPISVYCGGSGGMASVYVTFEGCHQGVSTTDIFSEEVNGDLKVTCKERCRARESTHASPRNSTCYCFNTTDLVGSSDSSICSEAGYLDIYDIAKYSLQGDTCEELFEKQIRMAGMYYMNNPLRKEQCYFKDGTVCEFGWVGYDGYCYFSSKASAMEFWNARQFCHENDAEIVSVLSQVEQEFLTEYRALFKDDISGNLTEPYWWLGMGDGTSSSLFMWLDGSMMRFSNFKLGTPAELDNQCAIEDHEYWSDEDCNEKRNVMCKKAAGWSTCISLPSLPVDRYEVADDDMSLTSCIERCKGQESMYALVQNETCMCTNTTAQSGFLQNTTECSTPCPGQTFQNCGGEGDVFTYINVSGMPNARSCEELQLIGLTANNYIIQPENTSSVQHCEAPNIACPYSWLSVGPHCYKAHLATEKPTDSFVTCAQDDAYGVSIETEEEITELLGTMNTIGIYSGQEYWRLGLYSLSLHGGRYRWPNGKQVNSTVWSNNFTVADTLGVAVKSTANNTWTNVDSAELHVFICEKGHDYVGCYNSVSAITSASISSDKMTIQLCVERCRADGQPYAYLNNTDCYCWSDLTDPWAGEGYCETSCPGQWGQVCGGENGQMSVYNVSKYPEFATTCDELFDASIFLSGDYIVNGTLTHCDLIDGTVCDSEWFGYLGNCYNHFFAEKDRTRAEICRASNATQVSLSSMDEWDVLTYYINRIQLYSKQRVFSGINNGGYGLDIFIGEDGLLVDSDLIESGLIRCHDLYTHKAYISFQLNQQISFHHDGGVICKKERHVLGCYEKPTYITPILENFGSVELTLCRQLCAAVNHNVTLIGREYCACASYGDVNSFAPPSGSCDDACSIHVDQRCGDGTVVWAHQTITEDVRYAGNCTSLYRAGILYESAYRLENTNPPGTLRYENCGFSDDTSCPPTMLGKDGECYRFETTEGNFTEAVASCFLRDTFLFNPISDTVIDFVDGFIQTSGLLDGVWRHHAGVFPVFYNHSYVASNGQFVVGADFSNETNKPQGQPAYDAETGVWFESEVAEELPYICQTDKAFLGCQSIPTTADASYESDWNSMTMCIQWCFGQDMQYAATQIRTCSCYVTLPSMTSAFGSCNMSCEAIVSQPCGGLMSDGSEAYSVVEISNDTSVASSCLDLYKYGVVQPGRYYIQSDGTSPPVNVTCFTEGGPYQAVKEENISSKWASSSMEEHPLSYSSFNFPSTDVWKPTSIASTEKLDFSLDEDRIITGVLTAGLRSAEEISFVTSFTLAYWDKLTESMATYVQNGSTELQPECDANTGICLLYLSQPFITDKVRFNPRSWHQSISVQMLVYGQSAVTFDYFDKYIGCFLDPENDFVNAGLTAADMESCIDYCKQSSYPFASIDEFDDCLCGSNGMEKGKVDDTDCPFNANGTCRTGLNNRRAVYRTYEAVCLQSQLPELVNGTAADVVFPYQDGVYTYATLVNYTCDVGFEHLDGATSEISVCQQNNQWTNLTKTCEIISCPPFTVVEGGVTFTSHQYQGVATVTCNETLYANNGQQTMVVTCGGNKHWSSIPTCSVHHEGTRTGNFLVTADTVRDQTAILAESKCRSRLDCAGKCNAHNDCKGANYRPSSASVEKGTCRLFANEAEGGELETETGWEYMEL